MPLLSDFLFKEPPMSKWRGVKGLTFHLSWTSSTRRLLKKLVYGLLKHADPKLESRHSIRCIFKVVACPLICQLFRISSNAWDLNHLQTIVAQHSPVRKRTSQRLYSGTGCLHPGMAKRVMVASNLSSEWPVEEQEHVRRERVPIWFEKWQHSSPRTSTKASGFSRGSGMCLTRLTCPRAKQFLPHLKSKTFILIAWCAENCDLGACRRGVQAPSNVLQVIKRLLFGIMTWWFQNS